MTDSGPRRALAAFFCACLLLPPPALAAAVAELGARPMLAAPSWTLAPAATFAPTAGAAVAPSLSLLAAPSAPLAALPAILAAPAAGPELPAEAAAHAVQLAPEQAAARSEPLAGAKERLRSAALSARALAVLLFGIPAPKTAPPLESFLRENQDYVLAQKRGALSDGSVVESHHPRLSPARASLAHPGLKSLLDHADALKASAQGEDDKLAQIRAAVAEALPRGRNLQVRALERRRALRRQAVELGDYADRGRGGEREAALLANLALSRAGLKAKLIRVDAWQREGGRVIEGERTLNLVHTSRGQVLFDTVSPGLDGRKILDATAPAGTAGLEAGISAELDGPRVYNPAGKPKTSGVTAHTIGEREMSFAVVGRSAADRLFKEDEKLYQAAAPEQTVAIEWLYFPFYVDGHTALRVGDKLYEFTRKGWRASSARAFLFNNPYFDTQMARHPALGIPPFSLGVPLTIAKADAARFAALADAGRGRFSFWFNNCNQVPFRFLRRAGLELGDGAFASFSSIRAFRLLLLDPPAQAGAPRIYPLPNQASATEPLGPAVPRVLVERRSVLGDLASFIWNWPKFVFEKLPISGTRP